MIVLSKALQQYLYDSSDWYFFMLESTLWARTVAPPGHPIPTDTLHRRVRHMTCDDDDDAGAGGRIREAQRLRDGGHQHAPTVSRHLLLRRLQLLC